MPDILEQHNCSQVFVPVVLLPVERFEETLDPQWLGKTANLQVLNALVDTGAQSTNITENAARKLGLEPSGMTGIHGVNGPAYRNYYIFKLGFVDLQKDERGFQKPSIHMIDREIVGPEFDCGADADFDVLLGMDILSIGTLTITHTGKFKVSF